MAHSTVALTEFQELGRQGSSKEVVGLEHTSTLETSFNFTDWKLYKGTGEALEISIQSTVLPEESHWMISSETIMLRPLNLSRVNEAADHPIEIHLLVYLNVNWLLAKMKEEENAKARLQFNIKRIKIITTEELQNFKVNNTEIEVMKYFLYLESIQMETVAKKSEDWD